MKKEYEKSIGKTIEFVFDQSDSDHEQLKFQFTDGSFLIVSGLASGSDVWYEGLYYRFVEPPNTNQTLIFKI